MDVNLQIHRTDAASDSPAMKIYLSELLYHKRQGHWHKNVIFKATGGARRQAKQLQLSNMSVFQL